MPLESKSKLRTGSLCDFRAPAVLYRINVWLVAVAPDAADATAMRTLKPEEMAVEASEAPEVEAKEVAEEASRKVEMALKGFKGLLMS